MFRDLKKMQYFVQDAFLLPHPLFGLNLDTFECGKTLCHKKNVLSISCLRNVEVPDFLLFKVRNMPDTLDERRTVLHYTFEQHLVSLVVIFKDLLWTPN